MACYNVSISVQTHPFSLFLVSLSISPVGEFYTFEDSLICSLALPQHNSLALRLLENVVKVMNLDSGENRVSSSSYSFSLSFYFFSYIQPALAP